MSKLIPFKANFQYHHNDNINKHFDEAIWKRLFEKNSELTTSILVHNHSVCFDIPYNKRDTKINLDFDQIHSTSPEKLEITDFRTNVEFKIDSKQVLVIQILDNNITFSNDKNEIYTVETNDNLRLIGKELS
jgi:hypothetical protein